MDETMANIKQMFDTIRITSTTADHTPYIEQLDKMAAAFGGINTDGLKLMWKRLDRVRGKNPALVQMAWKNYILQINALEIMFETNYTSLKQALEAAQEAKQKEENSCQSGTDSLTSCAESPAQGNQPTSPQGEASCAPEMPSVPDSASN